MNNYSKENYVAERQAPDDWLNHSNGQILSHFSHLIEGKRVLDIGCNHGAVTKIAALHYKPSEIWGIDINQEAINVAKTVWPNDSIQFEQWNAVETPFKRDYFDLVYSFHTMEHIWAHDLESFVKNVANCLIPNGYALIAVPYLEHYNDPTHVSFFNEDDLVKIMETNQQLTTIEIMDPMRWSDPNILVGLFQKKHE